MAPGGAKGDGKRRVMAALLLLVAAVPVGWLLLQAGAGKLFAAARSIPGFGLAAVGLVGLARLAVFVAVPLLVIYLLWTIGRKGGGGRDGETVRTHDSKEDKPRRHGGHGGSSEGQPP